MHGKVNGFQKLALDVLAQLQIPSVALTKIRVE